MQVMSDITEFVESELKLEVSKEKSSVVDPKQGLSSRI